MVLESPSRRTALAKLYLRRVLYALIIGLIFVLIIIATVLHNLSSNTPNTFREETSETALENPEALENSPETPGEKEPSEEVVENQPSPAPISFQEIVETWASKTGGTKSVYIYDLDLNQVAASFNSDATYNTASLYKLFVVYEGYRRLENRTWAATDLAGSTGYTILECLDLAIRESHSPCAETLWAKIGHATLDEIIVSDFQIQNSNISGLASTPTDIAKMLELFYHHPDFSSPELVARMKDSFLNQPATTYNWRQGLPSGFSSRAEVYNKVGWDYNDDEGYWNLYHDAAIVRFKIDDDNYRNFIVVVMTKRIPSSAIRNLGTSLEQRFYE